MNSLRIPLSVRHLSINIDDTSTEDRLTLKNCVEDFNMLGKRLKVEELRTLMLFGKYHGCFVKAFGDLFKEAKALRVVFLNNASYDVEDLLHNLYSLVHLRYLRIRSSSLARTRFPNKISRFYHMVVIDAKHCDIIDLPRDMSNLVKLRHFLVQNDIAHSSIVEVGKLKSLQELRRFVVKQEGQGFELRQIGHLVELCGSLYIYNLENVHEKEEADEAKLIQKSSLRELVLCWNIRQSNNDYELEEHVLERLKPCSNLLKLSIIRHGGSTCPSWLGMNLSVKSLESLCLHGVAWKSFPPIGELYLANVPREEISSKIPNKRFENLRRLELVDLPLLKKWVVHAPCQLFPFLEVLVIRGCSNLVDLSLSHSNCCQQEKEAYANLFPRLSRLVIQSCPQLLSFPPVPWTNAPCSIEIGRTCSSCFHKLVFEEFNSVYSLVMVGKDISDSTFWDVLDFHNLTKLKEFNMLGCQPLPLHHLQMLSSLRQLRMSCSNNAFSFIEGENHVKYQFPVEELMIDRWSASGKELTQLLTCFPKLSYLRLWECEKITWLGVMGQQATMIPGPGPSSSAEVDEAQIDQHQQQDARAEEEIVALVAQRLLLLPLQLQELMIWFCPDLILCSNPLDDNKQDGRTGGGGGLQGLSSLRKLHILTCRKLLSYSSSCFPFPNSLEDLSITGTVGTEALVPVSNLSSLASLSIVQCGDLRVKGLPSLLARGHLTKLYVTETPNFFVVSEPSRVHDQELPCHSPKLKELTIDDVAGVVAMAICSLSFSSLTTLCFYGDEKVKCFTEEQEALLFANSLEEIIFRSCHSLQHLPARLHTLPNLKKLNIMDCEAIQTVPKDSLPSSLQELEIQGCPEIQSLPKDSLPCSLQKLVIRDCPVIQSLPKVDDLPNSLRELDVRDSGGEGLKRQCRKLIRTIPIVRT
ncbi:unnamed protein product [Urochloa humidicola]